MAETSMDGKPAATSAQGTAPAAPPGSSPPPAQQRADGAPARAPPVGGDSAQAGSDGDASTGVSMGKAKQVTFADAGSKTPDDDDQASDTDMREADGDASADAAASEVGSVDSESKAPDAERAAASAATASAPGFKTPRHATVTDIQGLIFAGMLKDSDVELPEFMIPERPPHWQLPTPPDLETNAYLVGVPAITSDVRNGAFATEGYGGVTTLIGFEELSDDDLQWLKEVCGADSEAGVLQPRCSPLSGYELENSLNSVGVRREMASLLRHFNSTRFAERVFKMTGYLRRTLGAYKHMRSLAESQQGFAAVDELVHVKRELKERKRAWKFARDYWFQEIQEALGKSESVKREHEAALQRQKARYQDEIDALESEKAQLKARLSDSETQVRILKSRLEAATMDPWKIADFLQEHTDFTGNWERLHDLFGLCIKDSTPPETWDTVISVTAMDKRKVAVAPYPEKSTRMPPSSGSGSGHAARPETLDLTGPGSKPRRGATSGSRSQNSKAPQDSKKSQGSKKSKGPASTGKSRQSTGSKIHKIQRRPTDHQPGRDSVRRAGEKTVVSKEAAHTMLPGGVVWKEIRPDVRQAILAGLKYDSAMEWIGSDRAAHGHFRQPQLIKMLVSMMYWRRLDKTPWSKYVPEAYYEMADERLDRRLRRGEVPPPWRNLEDHVVYPDEDADSTVDDPEDDPDYKPPAEDPEDNSLSSSSSSSEEEFEPAAPTVLVIDDDAEEDAEDDATETPPKASGKRKYSGSAGKSQNPSPKSKKQRRKEPQKHKSDTQSSSAARASKVAARPKKPSSLACKAYSELTAEELATIEVPDDETSWRIHGILVQYPSSTKSASCQTPGFPEYEIHKFSYDVVHERWNRQAYQEILDSEPWVTMLQGRIRVFYFHERDMLATKALKLVEDIVDAMHKHAQAIWERGHWVPIPTEAEEDIALDAKRRSRRNALRRTFKALLERSQNTPGFIPSLLHEPGLWKIPDKVCYWIWEDPRVRILGGPRCEDLETQLAALDMREPARVQWNTADDEEWLQYVPERIQNNIKPAAIRKLNPLSLAYQ